MTDPKEPTIDFNRAEALVVKYAKTYVSERSGSLMNTSDAIFDPLTEHVQKLLDQAIESAKANGRKTVMDRDVVAAILGTQASY
jgi:histone H3/H4